MSNHQDRQRREAPVLTSPFAIPSGTSPKTDELITCRKAANTIASENRTEDHQPDMSACKARANDGEFADEDIEWRRADQRQRADHQQMLVNGTTCNIPLILSKVAGVIFHQDIAGRTEHQRL